MSIFIEIILWAMIVAGVALGVKTGFIRMASKPVKLILSIVIAFALCVPFAEGVVAPIIEKPISNYVYEFLLKNCPELNVENIAQELPTILKIAAGMYGIDIEEIVAQNAGLDIIAEITSVLSTPVIAILSTIISFVLLYFVSKLVITLILSLIDLIFSNGVFGVLNRTLGGISGAVISMALAWALSIFIEFICHINGSGLEDPGLLYNFFNTYSPIELFLSF